MPTVLALVSGISCCSGFPPPRQSKHQGVGPTWQSDLHRVAAFVSVHLSWLLPRASPPTMKGIDQHGLAFMSPSLRAGRLIRRQAPLSKPCQGRHLAFPQAPTTPESLEAMSRLRPCTLTQSGPGVSDLPSSSMHQIPGKASSCMA